MNQLRSELRKVTATKTWWILGLVATVLVAGSAALFFAVEKSGGTNDIGFSLLTREGVQNLYSSVGSSTGYLFALVLGIVAMTGEFRFGTIVPTFLTTPQRDRPVLAKIGALAIVTGAISLAVVVVTYAVVTVLLLTTKHAPVNVTKVVEIAFGAMLAYVLMGIVGVALGALLRNQILTLVLAILWVLIIEGIVTLLLNHWHLDYISKWLPASAVGAVVSTSSIRTPDQLPAWGGALVLIGYAAVFAGLAFVTTLRRDVS
jgi:ABC-type transport system involved in multi-copper enzyme maturation permease subunit